MLGNVDIDLINRCLFPPDDLMPADVAIVFGMNDVSRPAGRAAELYHQGLARTLLFTGGHNARIGAAEAVEMAKHAVSLKVSPDDILIESQARHTDENVLFSKDILENKVGLENISSIIILSIHYHICRARISTIKYFPSRIKIGICSYKSKFYESADWNRCDIGRSNVFSEIDKIYKYYGLTFCSIEGLNR